MAHQVGRKLGEFGWNSTEMRNANCTNDEIRLEHLAVVQLQHETVALPVERYDLPLLEVVDESLLEVQRVGIEELQTDGNVGGVIRNPPLGAICGERSPIIRGAEAGSEAIRLQHHPDWHVPTPAIQRSTEYAERNTVRAQVRRDRKSVWSRSDDGNPNHEIRPPQM